MWGRLKKSLLFHIFLLVVIGFALASALNMARNAFGVYGASEETKRKVEELSQKKEELEQYLAELQTKEGRERNAKERLNLKNIGEEVAVVVKEKEEKKEIPPGEPPDFWERARAFLASIIGW